MKTFSLLLIFSLFLSSCLSGESLKTFIYCSEASPSSFNPQITTDGTSINASAHTVYDGLVEFQYGSTEIVPGLAKSWEISDDSLTYTFNLRENVPFHSGKEFRPTRNFNADDVIFSFERQMNPEHPYHLISGGNYEYFNAMNMGETIESITKLSDYKVQITLTRPVAPFLANLAMSFMSILSAEYAEFLQDQNKMELIDQQPIGTGPFVFKRYRRDSVIRFSAFDDYWRGRADIDRLIFSITPDSSVRYQKLKAGECHLAIEPAPNDIPSMMNDDQIKLVHQPGFNIGYLAMNTQKEPFDDVRVRQAINHALNKESYIEAIYHGHAKVAKNPLPPSLWAYNQEISAHEYDPQKARELLIEAGYENGFETQIWTLPVTRPYNPNGRRMGEMMQADLGAVGIKVELVSYDWPTYLARSRQGEHDLLQLGWTGDNGDPDNFLYVLLGCKSVETGSNVARWCHDEFNQLIIDAKINSNQDDRKKLYKQAQEIFHAELPWAPIAHSIIFRAMHPSVEGYQIDPLGGDKFYNVRLTE